MCGWTKEKDLELQELLKKDVDIKIISKVMKRSVIDCKKRISKCCYKVTPKPLAKAKDMKLYRSGVACTNCGEVGHISKFCFERTRGVSAMQSRQPVIQVNDKRRLKQLTYDGKRDTLERVDMQMHQDGMNKRYTRNGSDSDYRNDNKRLRTKVSDGTSAARDREDIPDYLKDIWS